MGASGWSHFVPYQEDINVALQQLRQQVFEHGEYYKADHTSYRNTTEAEMLARLADSDSHIRQVILDDWRQVQQLSEPSDIESLLAWNREEGTHSILDIYRGVSNEPDFGTVSPLTDQQLRDLFSTTQPTHDMIESVLETYDITDVRDRWQGLYVIVYDDLIPVEIYFTGFSGD